MKTDTAYRGYLIRHTLAGETFIQRDGQWISGALNDATARELIDGLLDGTLPSSWR